MDCKFIFKEIYYDGKTPDLIKRKQEIEDFCLSNGIIVENVSTLAKSNPFDNLDNFTGLFKDIGKFVDNKENLNLLMLNYGQWIHLIPDTVVSKIDTVNYVRDFRQDESGLEAWGPGPVS